MGFPYASSSIFQLKLHVSCAPGWLPFRDAPASGNILPLGIKQNPLSLFTHTVVIRVDSNYLIVCQKV